MEAATQPKPAGLRLNAVGLPGAVIMSAAIMGPAVSTFFNPQFSTPFSGFATPLVYLLCLIAMLITASGVMEMARALPSAGAFYTYVTRGFGAKAGFVTGGLIFVAYALLPPAEIGLIGSYLQNTFNDEFSTNIPWWIIGLVPAIVMTVLAFEGIISSLRTALILFSAEVVVVVVMALIVVVSGGHEGLNLHSFNPGSSPHGFGGLVTGGIFAALSFVGFEAAASLGEEVKEPRKRIPKAILYSTLLVGGIYTFCIWAESMGLGQAGTNALSAETPVPPWNFLAAEYASWMKWPVIVASVSSMFAVMLASNNGIVRILHKMGREGLLPGPLGYIDPKRRTPIYAVLFQGVFAIGLAFIVGALAGGLGDPVAGNSVYGYLGFLLTMGILPVYILTNAAAIRFFRERDDFHPVRHLLLPGLGALLMVGLTVGQIVEQVEAPYTWFPWVILGWVALVSLGAAWLGVRRPQSLSAAGAAMGSVDDPEEEKDLALGVA
ncbi:MAG TPA: APC family permease [Solirubrobacterales bacterium]|jgi:amino acid transporter|nr:APC family permease [Solirubrobacterales bacterium]